MVERVARAIRLADNIDVPEDIRRQWENDADQKMARAVFTARFLLGAMYEPTEAMEIAADKYDGTHYCDRAPPDVHWRAMIKAALSENDR